MSPGAGAAPACFARALEGIRDKRSLHESLAGQAALYAQGIRSNVRCLDAAHAYMNFALVSGVAGVLGFAPRRIHNRFVNAREKRSPILICGALVSKRCANRLIRYRLAQLGFR
jgi:hypothetical protein